MTNDNKNTWVESDEICPKCEQHTQENIVNLGSEEWKDWHVEGERCQTCKWEIDFTS